VDQPHAGYPMWHGANHTPPVWSPLLLVFASAYRGSDHAPRPCVDRSNSRGGAGLTPELGDRFVIGTWYCRGFLAQVPSEGTKSGRSDAHSSLKSWIAATRVVDEIGDLLEAIKGIAHQDTVMSCANGVHNQDREVGEIGDGAHFQVITQNDGRARQLSCLTHHGS